MIVGLHGVLEARGNGWVVVNVNGVSYKASVPSTALSAVGVEGDRVRLYTSLHVREDSLALYGFATAQDLHLFELLQTVAGVGPKLALTILSGGPADQTVSAIVTGDERALAALPGVGKKIASRLVLELKGTLEKEWGALPAPARAVDGDAVAALTTLGYSQSEARSALAALPKRKKLSLEEQVRLALQQLAR
ncbi:MAG: Holliday junction branch migration protein RuvA [Chloroflexi bacterium]|nr:Holliday junction branch migration protein RuvA [Chloroflexota bacterium]